MHLSFARRTVALAVAVVVSAGLVTGCSDDGQGSSGEGGEGPSGSFTPGVQQLDLNAPLVKETFQVPGSDKNTVTVGVLGLESDGQLQVLHLAFTPNFASKTATDKISLNDMLGRRNFGPDLIDRKNLKVYGVVGGLKTDIDATTVNNQPLYVYVTFKAPEDDDRVFDVRINSEWQPFRSIECAENKGAEK
ncbi:MAG: hypothetical protein LBU50_01590 [Cellulomonas sp.]|nr:hypothetical protein [Cellulomonas sp.]